MSERDPSLYHKVVEKIKNALQCFDSCRKTLNGASSLEDILMKRQLNDNCAAVKKEMVNENTNN